MTPRRTRRAFVVRTVSAAAAGAFLLVAGCSGGDTSSPRSVAPDSSATTTASSTTTGEQIWDLVLLGDSVWLQPRVVLRERLEEELGVTLDVHSWINPDEPAHPGTGERSWELLDRLRTDEALRSDLREAEIIAFDVPFGAINECPPQEVDVAQCVEDLRPRYESDAAAIVAEVTALRDPADALIRTTTVWQFMTPTLLELEAYDAVRTTWRAMNAAMVRAVADAPGIVVLPGYDTFSGPDGERDPVAEGDVQPDEVHLTPKGSETFAELFVASVPRS